MKNLAPRHLALFAALGAVAASLAGCASSGYMKKSVAGALTPASDSAVVVFVRPSGMGSAIKTTVLDANGRFLGDALPSSYFSAKLPPGEHVFLAWAEGTHALRATLEAGKTYYVKVSPRLGVWSARMMLFALTPRHEDWPKLKEWLAKSAYEPDQAAGQAYLDGRKEEVQKRIQSAREALKGYDVKELEERTLRPEDGVSP